MIFSILLLTVCTDIKASSVVTVYSGSFGPYSITKNFMLTGEGSSYVLNEGSTSFSGTNIVSTTNERFSGTIMGHSITGTSSGRVTYQVDIQFVFPIDYPNGIVIQPQYLYMFDFYGSGLNVSSSVPSGSQCDVVSQSAYISMGGAKYYGTSDGSVHFADTGIYDRGNFDYVVDVSCIITTPKADAAYNYYVTCELGTFSSLIRRMPESASSVVQAVDKSTQVEQTGNQIAQTGNQIAQAGNKLQEEANETSKGIFNKISDFFGSFFDNIINAFKSLFIPEDDYFSGFFKRLNDFFSEKLGMLYTPIDLFVKFLTAIKNAGGSDAGIPFPGIEWDGVWLIEPQTISLSTYAAEFPELQEKIYFVTDIMMVGAVLWLLQMKLREVLEN